MSTSGPIDPRLVQRARSARPALVAGVVLGAAQAAMVLMGAVVLAGVLAAVVADGEAVADQRGALATLVALAVGRGALTWATAVAGRAAASAVKSDLRREVLDAVVRLDPAARAEARRGEVAVLLGHGLDSLDGYFARYLPQVVLAALIPPMVVVVAALNDLTAAIILALTLPLIPLFLALVGLATRDRTQRQWRALADLGAHLLDVIDGLPTLRIFGRVRHQRRVLAELAEGHRRATLEALRWAFTSALALELIATLATALVAVAVGLRLAGGSLDLRTGLVVLLLAPEAYLPLRNVGASFHASTEGAAAARDALDLLDTAPGTRRPTRNVGASGTSGSAELSFPTPISLEAVSVIHADRSAAALRCVSLSIEPGERVGVVGPSGSGKSTLLSVVLGFVPPTEGRVTIGGVGLADIDLDAWRRSVAWVPQRPHLFADGIDANIRLGAPDASTGQVRAAAEAAGLGDLLRRLPDGLATRVGAGGLPLSGGEAQRVALARAFLRDAPLVLLDEPTASLDEATERDVLDALRRLLDGRTALLVTHRTAPLELVERTLLLDGGRLVDPQLAPVVPNLGSVPR